MELKKEMDHFVSVQTCPKEIFGVTHSLQLWKKSTYITTGRVFWDSAKLRVSGLIEGEALKNLFAAQSRDLA